MKTIPTRRSWLPPATWTVLGASAMTTLGTLPVFLLSAQSVFVRSDLDFDERGFGVAVSAFFVAAAAAALVGGGRVDRLGRRASTVGAGLLTAIGSFGVAWAARSWLVLTLAMVVLGVANAACHMTSNVIMARVVPPHRQGLGFGVKQAAIPLAITLAGLAVPTVGALLGWRWTFALTGFGGLVIVLVGLRLPSATIGGRRTGDAPDRPSTTALVTIMIAVLLASAAGNSFGAFVASWGFRVGLTPDGAALLMAAGSAMNLVVRVVGGHLADRRYGRNLPVVAAQMLIGAVALAVLSLPSQPTVVVAAPHRIRVGMVLARAAAVRRHPDQPGRTWRGEQLSPGRGLRRWSRRTGAVRSDRWRERIRDRVAGLRRALRRRRDSGHRRAEDVHRRPGCQATSAANRLRRRTQGAGLHDPSATIPSGPAVWRRRRRFCALLASARAVTLAALDC